MSDTLAPRSGNFIPVPRAGRWVPLPSPSRIETNDPEAPRSFMGEVLSTENLERAILSPFKSLVELGRLGRGLAADVMSGRVLPRTERLLPDFRGVSEAIEGLGQPLTSPHLQAEAGLTPEQRGIASAVETTPQLIAGMLASRFGIPPHLAFAGAFGGSTLAATEGLTPAQRLQEAEKSALLGAAIPVAGTAGSRAASAALIPLVERGLLPTGATTTQKVAESLGSQLAAQGLIEAARLPEYVQATPEGRVELLRESLGAGLGMGAVMEAPRFQRGVPSETQARLRPEVKLSELTGREIEFQAERELAPEFVDREAREKLAPFLAPNVPRPPGTEKQRASLLGESTAQKTGQPEVSPAPTQIEPAKPVEVQQEAPTPKEPPPSLVAEAPTVLRSRESLGFNPQAKIEGSQLGNRLKNKLTPGEYLALEEAGLKEFLKGKRTPEEVAQWVEENGPKVEVKKLWAVSNGVSHEIADIIHQLETRGYHIDTRRANKVVSKEGVGTFDKFSLDTWKQKVAPEDVPLLEKVLAAKPDLSEPESATSRFTVVNPKPLKQMPGAVDLLVRIPLRKLGIEKLKKAAATGMIEKASGVKHSSSHFPKEGKNLLAHVRGYEETLPSGEKVFLIFEIQGDWPQERRKFVERNKDRPLEDIPGFSTRVADDPLLKHYERLAVKAAIDHARSRGIRRIAIVDAETAMVIEGHDRVAQEVTPRTVEHVARVLGDPMGMPLLFGPDWREGSYVSFRNVSLRNQFYRVDDPEKNFSTIKHQGLDAKTIARELQPYAGKGGNYIPQERGMRFHYDETLPRIARELTGEEGTVKEFGPNKNAFEDPEAVTPEGVEVRLAGPFKTREEAIAEVRRQKETAGDEETILLREVPIVGDTSVRSEWEVVRAPSNETTQIREGFLFTNSNVVARVFDVSNARESFTLFGSDKGGGPKSGTGAPAQKPPLSKDLSRKGIQQPAPEEPSGAGSREASVFKLKQGLSREETQRLWEPDSPGRPHIVKPSEPGAVPKKEFREYFPEAGKHGLTLKEIRERMGGFRGEAGFVRLPVAIRAKTTTPLVGKDALPDFDPKALANQAAAEKFGADRVPILGRLMGGRYKVRTPVDKALAAWYLERYGIGPSHATALMSEVGGEAADTFKYGKRGEVVPGVPGRRFEEGDLFVVPVGKGRSLKFDDVFTTLLSNPGAYKLTPEQERVWRNIIRPIYERIKEVTDANNLSDPQGAYFFRTPSEKLPIGISIHVPFKSEAEAWSKGVRYLTDVRGRLGTAIENMYKAWADVRLAKDPALDGRSVSYYKSLLKSAFPTLSAADLKRKLGAVMKEGTVRIGDGPHPAFMGKLFKPEVAEALNREFASQSSVVRRAIADVNSFGKAIVLGYDWGVGQIQLSLLAMRRPDLWAKAQVVAMGAFFSPDVFAAYVRNNRDAIRELARYGSSVGRIEEYMAGLGAGGLLVRTAEGLPETLGKVAGKPGEIAGKVLGKAVAEPTKAFVRHFQTALDVAKVELWKAWGPHTPASEKARMVQTIESLLLSGRMESGMVTPNRALWERALFLAPAYYRGAINLIANAGLKSKSGRETIRSLAHFSAGSVALYWGVGMALGMKEETLEERMDPRLGSFMMWDVDDGEGHTLRVGLGGIYRSTLRLTAETLEFAQENQGSWKDVKLNEVPAWKFYRSHAAPFPGFSVDAIVGRDVIDRDLTALGGIAKFVTPLVGESKTKKEAAIQMVGFLAWPGPGPSAREVARELFPGKEVESLPLHQRRQLAQAVEERRPPKSPQEQQRAAEQAMKRAFEKRVDIQKAVSKESREFLAKHGLQLPSFTSTETVRGQRIPLTDKEVDFLFKEIVKEYDSILELLRKQPDFDSISQEAKENRLARIIERRRVSDKIRAAMRRARATGEILGNPPAPSPRPRSGQFQPVTP